jgi:branched-chain amino acid transport system permease protein
MWDPLFFLEVLIGGLLSGVMYSLVALGFVLIFKASGVFNFAQGALVLFAALTFVLLNEVGGEFWSWTAWLSFLLAFVALGLFLLSRYTTLAERPVFGARLELVLVAGGLLVLLALFGGEQNLWRAVFITFLVFFTLCVGEKAYLWAAGILLALGLASLLPADISVWRALGIALVVMILLAMAVEWAVLRPLVNQAPIILFMATIGLNFVIEGMAQGVWDSDVHALDQINIPDVPVEVGGIYISQFDVFAAVTAGVLVAGLAFFFYKTRVGRALRAVADDHQAAMAVGISLKNIWAVVWAAAGIVALVAGLLWGSKLGVQFSLALLAFKALPVLILGGFTSIAGAVVGGLIVGAVEKTFEVFVGIPYLGGGTESWSPYMLAMVFLLFRPQGLFGEKIIERV